MMDAPLKTVEVNGNAVAVHAATLADLVIELGYGERLVATALNQTFIRKADRKETPLQPLDRIEILVPMQGG